MEESVIRPFEVNSNEINEYFAYFVVNCKKPVKAKALQREYEKCKLVR